MKAISICLGFSLFLGFSITSLEGSSSESSESVPQNQQYLFLFFYKDKNERTEQSERIFDQTISALDTPTQAFKVNINDPNQKTLIAKYGLERAPMPMALVVAPSGAVTGGFPYTFTVEQLKSAIVSPGVAAVLNGLQNRKLVFLAIQNSGTQSNESALRGVQDMQQDPRFANAIEIIRLDPTDQKEQLFLNQFGVNVYASQAQTVFLAPPGDKINTYVGATNKEQFVSDLQKAVSGCCPGGCCPGGCCPGGRCGK
jgi:hypothetical protein